MSTTAPSRRVDQRRIYNPIQKDAVTFLETSAESNGRRALLELELAPGGGNSLHRHMTYGERFDVLEGTLTVEVSGTVHRLTCGEQAAAPAGAMHRFANETDERVVFRVEVTPGHPGFEHALQIVYGLASDGLVRPDGTPKSITHAALLIDLSETRVGGLIGLLTPLLKPVAWLARRRGIDRQLIERYGVT
jgi:quercetin dioxygenase-like cupin family protein